MLQPDELEVLQLHAASNHRLAAALEKQNELREKELRASAGKSKRERSRQTGWLFADEVVEKLRPLVTETQSLKILREQGLLGVPGEGFRQQGRTIIYNQKAVEQLKKRHERGEIQNIRRK